MISLPGRRRVSVRTPPGDDMPDQRRITRRHVIITLAALAGLFGELLAAVSTTRIAGPALVAAGETAGKLGFPYDLRWTLFGVISVAGWVGAILWTSSNVDDRRVGPWLNLPAAVIAGIAVGLDHGVHADPAGPWSVLAFIVGPIITLTSSAMLHVISRMLDRAEGRSSESEGPPLGDVEPVTYESDEGDYNPTDEDATPPEGVPSIGSGQAAVDRQIEWINGRDVEPTVEQIVAEFGMSERTAFRRLGAARKVRAA